jgi:hypothetical protein
VYGINNVGFYDFLNHVVFVASQKGRISFYDVEVLNLRRIPKVGKKLMEIKLSIPVK